MSRVLARALSRAVAMAVVVVVARALLVVVALFDQISQQEVNFTEELNRWRHTLQSTTVYPSP